LGCLSVYSSCVAPIARGLVPGGRLGRRDRLGQRVDADAAPVAADPLPLHRAVDEGEEGEVATHADVVAREVLRPALADEDGAGADDVTVVALDTQPLGLAVAPVSGAAHTLFVRHVSPPCLGSRRCGVASGDDLLNGQAGQLLAVPLLAPVALLGLELEDDDLLALDLVFDAGDDPGAFDDRRAHTHVLAVGDQEHPVQGHVSSWLGVEALDLNTIADRYPVLLTASLNYRVH